MSEVGGPLPGFESLGPQAQNALLLQLMSRLVIAAEGGNTIGLFGSVIAFTGAGDFNIGTVYPSLKAGIFSIRKAVAAATAVTLPPKAGPWIVLDGNGGAAANNITLTAPLGFTIRGAATLVMATNWQWAFCLLDGTNFLPMQGS